jgi:hypothetical protein
MLTRKEYLKEYHHKHYIKNKAKIKIQQQKWRQKINYKEYVRQYNSKHKNRMTELKSKWAKENRPLVNHRRRTRYRKVIRDYFRNRYNTDPLYKNQIKVRLKTKRIYGKLPPGWNYHHIAPYRYDVWLGVTPEEHWKFDRFNLERQNSL